MPWVRHPGIHQDVPAHRAHNRVGTAALPLSFPGHHMAHEREGRLDAFHALLRTPITPGEHVAAPCTLPEGAVVPERRNLFPSKNLEIPVPTRIAVLGFLLGCACVLSIVWAFILIVRP